MAKRRQHSARRRKAREIRAAGSGQMIRMQAGGIEWIEAEAGSDQPKRFSMTAYTGGAVMVGFYSRPVVIDLEGLKAEAPVPILLNHEYGQIVGHSDDVGIGQSSLKLKGLISGAGQAANEVIASSARGFPWKASVGVQPEKLEFVGEDVTVRVNGKSFRGPIYVARKGVLREVSFVAVAADNRTSAKVAASAAKPTKEDSMDLEQWIEALGFTMETLTDAQKSALESKYTAEVKAAAKKESGKQEGGSSPARPEPAAAVNAGGTPAAGVAIETHKTPAIDVPRFDHAAISLAHVKHETAIEAKAVEYTGKIEADKLAGIKAKAAKAAIELKSKALEEEWAATRLEVEQIKAQAAYEVELIRAERPAAPAIHASSREGLSAELIEAACCLSGGYAEVEKEYKPEVLAAAEKRFGRSVGLQELILEAAWANGYTGRGFRDTREIMRAAFSPVRAGFSSTIDIAGILSNVSNKFLLAGFLSVERVWREIAAIRSVSDFKTVTSYRLIGADQYKLVNPGGELEHGNLGEETYSNKADTYGLILGIDRRDIINDDLGAITTVPQKLGRGSGLKINDVFWTEFLNNAAFFAAARNNYFEGTADPDSRLGIDGLSYAEQLFMDQVDSDGKPLGVMPAILLVPTAHSAQASALMNSTEIRNTTASNKYPVYNPHQGKFRNLVSRYLSNSSYTGYSSTAWYLLADPADLPVIEIAFLRGQESPTIEQADADFNVLGIQMRGYHDFGVNKQDHRGGVKAKGAA